MVNFTLAFIAPAAFGLDEFVPKFFSVIISEFFACFDVSLSGNVHSLCSGEYFTLTIGATGMVDVARQIFAPAPVDGPFATDFEEILPAA